MNERDAFIAGIKADPADDTRRLGFADWLEENAQHDRDKATAEFIRMSCTMTQRKAIDRQVGKWLGDKLSTGNIGKLIPGLAQWIERVNKVSIGGLAEPVYSYKREGRWLVVRKIQAVNGSGVRLEFWRGFVRRVVCHCPMCADRFLPKIIPDQPLCEPTLLGHANPKKKFNRTFMFQASTGDAIWRHLVALPKPWKPDGVHDYDYPGNASARWEDWETRPHLPPHAVRARWALCMAMHAAAREIMEGKREPGVGALMTEEVTK